MSRRGFSLVEVLLALALLGALAAPAFLALARSDAPVSAALVRARRIADRITGTLTDMDPDELAALARVAGGSGFVVLDPAKAGGVPPADVAELALTARLRLARHAGGRFGLDRLDLEVEFTDGRRPHRLQRTVVKRNGPQLAALARVRLHGEVEKLTDAELADGLEYAAYEHGVSDQVGFAEGSPYPVRQYPALLAQFEPPVTDDAVLALRKSRREALGDRFRLLSPTYTSPGDVPRPRFTPGLGVAH